MALSVFQSQVTDEAGNLIDTPQITVRREVSGLPLATGLKEDKLGVTPRGNPFDGDSDGYFRFYAPAGVYRIIATKGAFSRTWYDVPLGTAQSIDSDAVQDVGYPLDFDPDTTTSATAPAGTLHANHVDLSLATILYVSETANNGNSIANRLAELAPGGRSVPCAIILTSSDGLSMASFTVTGYTDRGTDVALTVAAHNGTTAFPEGSLFLARELSGDDGADSTVPGPQGEGLDYDEIVADIAARDALIDLPAGYRVAVSDIGDGSSAIYEALTGSPVSWSDPIHIGSGGGSGVSLESATLHFLASSLSN